MPSNTGHNPITATIGSIGSDWPQLTTTAKGAKDCSGLFTSKVITIFLIVNVLRRRCHLVMISDDIDNGTAVNAVTHQLAGCRRGIRTSLQENTILVHYIGIFCCHNLVLDTNFSPQNIWLYISVGRHRTLATNMYTNRIRPMYTDVKYTYCCM
jgi:hypothetical protein